MLALKLKVMKSNWISDCQREGHGIVSITMSFFLMAAVNNISRKITNLSISKKKNLLDNTAECTPLCDFEQYNYML